MPVLNVYYRISDQSYSKPKLPGASKETCLKNFMEVFKEHSIRIIADRCSTKTTNLIKWSGIPYQETDLGNAGSFRFALNLALQQPEDSVCYFVEDDYLHQLGTDKVLLEGFTLAEYVTLYDHPDKYTKIYKNGEISQVRKTSLSHWRYTLSTCMTFGARVEYLKHDRHIFEKHILQTHPNDHQIFCDINGIMRRLAVSIPGQACHTDLTFSGQINHLMIDNWAIYMMNDELNRRLLEFQDDQVLTIKSNVIDNMLPGWEKLKVQDSLLSAMKLQ